jgi:hypothetical protein
MLRMMLYQQEPHLCLPSARLWLLQHLLLSARHRSRRLLWLVFVLLRPSCRWHSGLLLPVTPLFARPQSLLFPR